MKQTRPPVRAIDVVRKGNGKHRAVRVRNRKTWWQHWFRLKNQTWYVWLKLRGLVRK